VSALWWSVALGASTCSLSIDRRGGGCGGSPPQPWGFRNAPKLLSYGTKTIQEGLANSDVPLLSRTSTSRVGSASYGATSYGAVATVEEEAQLDPFSSASDADDSDD
jgi:hypothetical protein